MPDPYNPWATPIFPDNAMQPETFVPGGLRQWTQQAAPKDYNILSQIAGALGRGFMAPGQALQSTTPITSEQMIAPAQSMTSAMISGGMPMAEKGAAGIFGGRLAQTADQGALAKAEQLHAAGAPREQIWNDTGWFKGADDKWRFEIPDNASKIGTAAEQELAKLGKTEGTAPQILWHKDLYNAYPGMRTLETTAEATPINAGYGRVRGSHSGFDTPLISASAPGPDALRSTLLHEIQHEAQRIEGFASGANTYGLKPGTPAWDIYQERLKAVRTPLSFDDFVKQAGYDDLAQAAKDYKPYLKQSKSPSPMIDRAAQEFAVQDAYRRAAGEVEARNVQARQNMTPDQLRATPPWLTQDVPDALQIYRGSK